MIVRARNRARTWDLDLGPGSLVLDPGSQPQITAPRSQSPGAAPPRCISGCNISPGPRGPAGHDNKLGGDSRASGGGIQAPGSGWGMDESPAVVFAGSDFPRSCGADRLPVLSANPDLSVRATRRSRSRGGILLRAANVHRRRMAPNRLRITGYSVRYRWGC